MGGETIYVYIAGIDGRGDLDILPHVYNRIGIANFIYLWSKQHRESDFEITLAFNGYASDIPIVQQPINLYLSFKMPMIVAPGFKTEARIEIRKVENERETDSASSPDQEK